MVTGNGRPVAELKLGAFVLDTHIQWYGAYGEDDDERAEPVHIAMRRAGQGLDVHIAADDVMLVGDTPADMAAGRGNDVPALAVASGQSSVQELREAGATMVVADLGDPRALLRALGRA
ncbi:HAD hydrolase-like protein [Streptomyces sp. HNM0663]|uniref:HAD hydrolase-like protein n=1 Tax=Streptomyces chengmaiensis TaxID=3040919 RepID=A0ABT6HW83_9ACTN|nr:HAD hydrolase-like protein [Streptomyces chengmaiensis]MDH2392967.1 HAD hydrolase-like protein [Streptomyces chengmaiensis]